MPDMTQRLTDYLLQMAAQSRLDSVAREADAFHREQTLRAECAQREQLLMQAKADAESFL